MLCRLPFKFLFIYLFCYAEAFQFDQPNLFIFAFVVCATQEIALQTNVRNFFPIFSPRSFIISGLIFKFLLLNSSLFCEWCQIGVHPLFCIQLFSFSKTIYVKIILSPLNIFESHVKYLLTAYLGIYFHGLNSAPLVYMIIFMPKAYFFDYHSSGLQFKIRKCDSSCISF